MADEKDAVEVEELDQEMGMKRQRASEVPVSVLVLASPPSSVATHFRHLDLSNSDDDDDDDVLSSKWTELERTSDVEQYSQMTSTEE